MNKVRQAFFKVHCGQIFAGRFIPNCSAEVAALIVAGASWSAPALRRFVGLEMNLDHEKSAEDCRPKT